MQRFQLIKFAVLLPLLPFLYMADVGSDRAVPSFQFKSTGLEAIRYEIVDALDVHDGWRVYNISELHARQGIKTKAVVRYWQMRDFPSDEETPWRRAEVLLVSKDYEGRQVIGIAFHPQPDHRLASLRLGENAREALFMVEFVERGCASDCKTQTVGINVSEDAVVINDDPPVYFPE